MHTCSYCGRQCDCDGEDHGQPQPEDCACPCDSDAGDEEAPAPGPIEEQIREAFKRGHEEMERARASMSTTYPCSDLRYK